MNKGCSLTWKPTSPLYSHIQTSIMPPCASSAVWSPGARAFPAEA